MTFFIELAIAVISLGIKSTIKQKAEEEAAYEEAKAAQREYQNYMALAEQAENNAEKARKGAVFATETGEQEAADIGKEGRIGLGQNRVSLAGGLFSTKTGTNLQLQNQFQAGVAQDVATRLKNAAFTSDQLMADYANYIIDQEKFEQSAEDYQEYFWEQWPYITDKDKTDLLIGDYDITL